MSYNPNDRYSTTPCTPYMVAGRVQVPPPCPDGWDDNGLMPSGSCVTYTGEQGWRRICTKSRSGGGGGGSSVVSNVSCCIGDNLTQAQKDECKKRDLEPHNMGCDLLMYNTCNISGSTDCDDYLASAPRGTWFDHRTYEDGPPPVLGQGSYHTPPGYYPQATPYGNTPPYGPPAPQYGGPPAPQYGNYQPQYNNYGPPYGYPVPPSPVPVRHPLPVSQGETPQNWWSTQYAMYPRNAYSNYAATARDETAYFCDRNPEVCHALAYNY